MIYGKWFSGRLIAPMNKVVNHPLLRLLKKYLACDQNYGEHIPVSGWCLDMSLKPSSRCSLRWGPAVALASSYLPPSWPALWIYVVLVIRAWNPTAALLLQLGERSHRGLPPQRLVFSQRLSPNHCNYYGNTCLFVCWNGALVRLYAADRCRRAAAWGGTLRLEAMLTVDVGYG